MKSRLSIFEFLFALLILLVFLSPYLNVLFPGQILLAFELAYSLIIMIFDSQKRQLCYVIVLCAIIIAGLYVVTTDIRTITSMDNRVLKGLYSFAYQYITMFFPLIVFARVMEKASLLQKTILVISAFIVLLYTVHDSIQVLQINPGLMKSQMVSDLSADDPIVGGYFYIIGGPIWVTGFFYCFLKINNKLLKAVSLLICGYCLYYVSFSGYTIAFISCLIGCLCCFYVENKDEKNKMLWLLMPFLIIILAAPIIRLLISIMPSESMALGRMEELLLFSTSSEMAGTDMGGRFQLYWKGIVSFLSSPIWGNYSLTFNSHSTFIEILASLGILGGITLYKQLKISITTLNNYYVGFSMLPIIVVYIFQASLNPINSSLSIAVSVWLFIPLLFDVVNEYQNRHNLCEEFDSINQEMY